VFGLTQIPQVVTNIDYKLQPITNKQGAAYFHDLDFNSYAKLFQIFALESNIYYDRKTKEILIKYEGTGMGWEKIDIDYKRRSVRNFGLNTSRSPCN